jgi:CheY-like chemotaxis protein
MRERHKFAVRLRPSAVPPPALQQDVAVLVYQSVRELLLNAVKHSGVTTAEVGITRDGTALRFEVSDAGVGLDSASLRVTGGTEGGFGLLGIRERLESVGGHLDIASTPGQGSRFVLTVPLPPQPEEEASSRPRMEAAAEPDTEERSGRQLRVLLVDDHVLIRRAVATMIAAEPDLVVVGEAADGKAAVALTRELEPDVVVMDISMPVLDGIQATRAIRQAHPSVRVIGLSMLGAVDQPAAMREAGAAACVSKSDSAETLLAAIRGGGTPRE